jgi:hypothetical protein
LSATDEEFQPVQRRPSFDVDRASKLLFHACFVFTVAYLTNLLVASFYWKTVCLSGFFAWTYQVVLSPLPPWRSSTYRRRNISHRKTLKLGGYVVLLLWCLSLSPLHIIVSPIDLWTEYQVRPSIDSEVVHDPGKSARIE